VGIIYANSNHPKLSMIQYVYYNIAKLTVVVDSSGRENSINEENTKKAAMFEKYSVNF